jgi:methyltransferase (TIGR00027 family)
MKAGTASRTAVSAAAMRAAHLHLYSGAKIFEDAYALALSGIETTERLRAVIESGPTPDAARVAAYFALRHRYAEDRLKAALARGVNQVVLLGAGLDTFALRNPGVVGRVRFIEIDHPDSQRAKLSRLAELGLETPGVEYLSVDFSTQDLAAELKRAGVARERATFFPWLGVTQYISRGATDATLSLAANFAKGSEIVFDVIRPFDGLDAAERAISSTAASMSERFGEKWLSFYTPEELRPHLHALGFSQVDWLSKEKAAPYYVGQAVEPLTAWQMVSAVV